VSNQTKAPEIEALERAVRVSDQSCTAYAILRDRYRRFSTALDLMILVLSAWLTAMVFVQPEIGIQLSPRGVSKDLWIGLLSIAAFCLSLVQLQVNWKGRAISYQLAATALSGFVKEFRPILGAATVTQAQVGLARYQVLSDSLEPIPDSKFLALKQAHAVKVEMSKHLDQYPGASLSLLRFRLWWRDTWQSKKPSAK